MEKQYLIFTDPQDVYNNFSIFCYKGNLNQELIEQELLEPGMSYTQTSWVIFEDCIMIQG